MKDNKKTVRDTSFFILTCICLLMITSCSAQEKTIEEKEQTPLPNTISKDVLEPVENEEKEPSTFFTTGQDANLMLSGIDFNNAGGSLLFNHPGGIASDGVHLALADRNNNRVLIWNTLPKENTEPDLVLGQPNFTTNTPGNAKHQMNWPIAVAMDGTHLVVADAYNHRILIWNTFPKETGEPADVILERKEDPGRIEWPWAVWTNGTTLIVTNTMRSEVLIWNTFPKANEEPDIILKNNDFGTPRSIGSNGKYLIISDHNAKKQGEGTFFWTTFPKSNEDAYDFFMSSPTMQDQMSDRTIPVQNHGVVLFGPQVTSDGMLLTIGNGGLLGWKTLPSSEQAPAQRLGGGYDFGAGASGDGSGIAVTESVSYISLSNGNKVVGYTLPPNEWTSAPEFVIGSQNLQTNTLETNGFITNPIPISDGEHLFVSSDFDRKLYVWRELPKKSGTLPDLTYKLEEAPWDNAWYENTLILAGRNTVYIWETLPLNNEQPDVLKGNIGTIPFNDIKGVALDGTYFYLANQGKIYVWEGLPTQDQNPLFSIDAPGIGRIESDGTYLTGTLAEGTKSPIVVYKISDFPNPEPHYILGRYNLPMHAIVKFNHLFVADTVFNRVLIWKNISSAFEGKDPDVILGQNNMQETNPSNAQDRLFWPGALSYDGNALWVGEFKFSGRLVKFEKE